jgi:hypothetical protein
VYRVSGVYLLLFGVVLFCEFSATRRVASPLKNRPVRSVTSCSLGASAGRPVSLLFSVVRSLCRTGRGGPARLRNRARSKVSATGSEQACVQVSPSGSYASACAPDKPRYESAWQWFGVGELRVRSGRPGPRAACIDMDRHGAANESRGTHLAVGVADRRQRPWLPWLRRKAI